MFYLLFYYLHFDHLFNLTFSQFRKNKLIFASKKVDNEAIAVFGHKNWLKTDFKSLPSRDELAKLVLSEACLKVRLLRINSCVYAFIVSIHVNDEIE